MAGCLNFSLTGLQNRKLYESFKADGLEPRMIDICNDSTIHCWVPKGFTSAAGEEEVANGNGQQGQSEKPVLVLLHGFGASATWQWGPQVKALRQHFTLIIPDLLFFGLSTTNNPQRSETFQAECMWLMLVTLGIKKFSVAGTSYGGFVAYRLAQAHEDAIEKMVLSNSSVCMTPEDNQGLLDRGNASTVPELLLPTTRSRLDIVSSLALNKPGPPWYIPNFIVNDVINVLYTPNRDRKVELLRDLAVGKEIGASLMTKVDKDVLILWGDNDRVFLPKEAECIKNYLGERAKLVILKDAGHTSHMEHPKEWNSLVLKFLLGTGIEERPNVEPV